MQCIIYQHEGATKIFYPTAAAPSSVKECVEKFLPAGVQYQVVDSESLPKDRTFRNAWHFSKKGLSIDLNKAKATAHDIRRRQRAKEFEPLDDIISKRLPDKSFVEAETERQAIREKYSVVQTKIDEATSTAELKAALNLGE